MLVTPSSWKHTQEEAAGGLAWESYIPSIELAQQAGQSGAPAASGSAHFRERGAPFPLNSPSIHALQHTACLGAPTPILRRCVTQ